MSALADLDQTLSNLLTSVPLKKSERNKYLTQLRNVLDMYLFSVMEEEDPLYRLLNHSSEYVGSANYKSMKILSPSSFQLKIVMALPFQPHQFLVTYGKPGFVKLKMPSSIRTEITNSRVWVDACHRGIQGSLLRHLNSWKDENDFLKQTAFLKWFETVIDKSLSLIGIIPNYHISRLQTTGKVTLGVEELSNGFKFTVELLPVIAFPINQLPENLSEIFQDSTCSEWMVECRCNTIGSDQLWGFNLWQHEREFITRNTGLKPMIQILKCLRDGCKWNELKNYHIRTLVMTSHQQSPSMFDDLTRGAILLILLFELRNRLVSKTGLPFFWDKDHNLLCGLNGLQRSELARSITKTRDCLQSFDKSYSLMFWLDTYSPSEPGPAEERETRESTASCGVESQSSLHQPCPTVPQRSDDANRGSERFPPTVTLRAEDSQHSGAALQMDTRQETNMGLGNIAIAGATAVAAIAGFVLYRNRKNN